MLRVSCFGFGAFGASTAFDAPIAGVVQVSYETSALRYIYLALQAAGWLVLLVLAANFSRFRGRIQKIDDQRITMIHGGSQNAKK